MQRNGCCSRRARRVRQDDSPRVLQTWLGNMFRSIGDVVSQESGHYVARTTQSVISLVYVGIRAHRAAFGSSLHEIVVGFSLHLFLCLVPCYRSLNQALNQGQLAAADAGLLEAARLKPEDKATRHSQSRRGPMHLASSRALSDMSSKLYGPMRHLLTQ